MGFSAKKPGLGGGRETGSKLGAFAPQRIITPHNYPV
jgi:hypothetical protein